MYYSLSTQSNTTALLNDTWVANRADIDYSACLPSAITDNSMGSSFMISPNPFSEMAKLKTDFPMDDATLTVSNWMGQVVKQIGNLSGHEVMLSCEGLAAGLYFARLTQGLRDIGIQKIRVRD